MFSGTVSTNSYFMSFSSTNWLGGGVDFSQDDWLLFVAYIYPTGTTGTTDTDAGVYSTGGVKLANTITKWRRRTINDQ